MKISVVDIEFWSWLQTFCFIEKARYLINLNDFLAWVHFGTLVNFFYQNIKVVQNCSGFYCASFSKEMKFQRIERIYFSKIPGLCFKYWSLEKKNSGESFLPLGFGFFKQEIDNKNFFQLWLFSSGQLSLQLWPPKPTRGILWWWNIWNFNQQHSNNWHTNYKE